MIGTHLETMGGISSVVNVYRAAGLFARWPITYIATHCDGSGLDKLGALFRGFVQFMVLLLSGRIKLVHAHVSSRASFWRKSLFLLPAMVLSIPVVLHLHGSEFAIFFEKECGDCRKALVRFVFNRASRVVVLSAAWKQWVQGMCTNPHVLTIYNPALLPRQSTEWSCRKAYTVLCLGRLGKRKGSYDLLDAVAQLTNKHPHVKLLLGGDGEIEQVRVRAADLGISDHVHLLGWVRGEGKDRYLRSATIYALPSHNEGLPMSVLEAMAASLPIVSTSVGGIPEAVSSGTEGYLVEPGDIPSLVACLDRLLSEEGLAERMGVAARCKVEATFSAQAILPQVEAIYRELGAA
ncbi:glycosyltransferase family 4 protein [Accumulibacter sp.]|uniref:glycosyltransferase family 4 protein n=1 Tax=Accumulibacter sp. TaxID=2053492 RepID=UPI0025FA2BFA|nr:glycosyltransferase family 4 protein [Accumulibacter sp.]MCM8611629.1 glycosyltransferase family 4 protein [Accumulibacter sp.]MCM8635394.1 glycosyltransferase family 4 protein [Accumulibacter sp.]MCM8638999.1 glycosyltransferase family 4 protein [Accumulibacter sp.]